MTGPAVAHQPTTPQRASKMASSQSLNHLLNFSLPPRQAQPLAALPRRSRKPGGNYAVWNKERFVNAQYRFVVNPGGDYTVHFADPDIFFQWPDILQVIIPRSSSLGSSSLGAVDSENGDITCPVCLSPPTAARMTKCGHVYCFPCILHYLNTSENKWARCPICFDSVNEKQLKSVKWFDGAPLLEEDVSVPNASSSSTTLDAHHSQRPQEGSLLRMRLMQRPQISTLALPRSHTWPSDLLPPHQAPFYFLPDVYNFAKFMLATPEYLMEDLTRDLNELAKERRTLASMNDDLGISFVDAAEEKVLRQIAKAETLISPQLQEAVEKAQRDQREIEARVSYHERLKKEHVLRNPSRDVADRTSVAKPSETSSSFTPDVAPSPIHHNRNTPRQRRNVNPPPPSTSTYYYYQAASGYPIYLHPLDIKILLSHFASYPSFPDTITVRIESSAEGTINDDLRKRCKYLAHLPEGADVVFIEADLEDVVGETGLKNFEGALRTRRNKRKEKERKDDRARARAEERERERATSAAVKWSFSSTPPEARAETPSLIDTEETSTPIATQQPSGAWGARSFASALHSSSSQPRRMQSTPVAATAARDEDDWDLDAAWLELERSGGRPKRRNKQFLVLGGGGRRR